MKRSATEENGETKQPLVKQEVLAFTYDNSYATYSSSSASPSTANQPLPGQPPLPPMPPPPGAVPPPPHVFGPVHSQVTPIQTWAHAPPWQWMTPQTSPLPPQSPRDIATSTFQREMPLRGNYIRRDRFNHNRNNVYIQRNNFHRKNRRHPRFEQAQGQFDQATYFGPAVAGTIGLDWQRNNFATASTDALINHMSVAMSNHQLPSIPPGLAHVGRHGEELGDQEAKVVSEEIVVKKNKQRKPMSQSYPSRPWNREDAERALQIENEYNKTVKAQSLIIKFPDPDLNKDIVREFHSGIQNIHFQSPSGPRYCFIQMAENVNIDDAIKELEKIPFGVGHLKVERKSLRDEDNPMPEEIDPYTLYIGNLPESVNVNEVKSKFPSAARVDVGYAQKMRNTRYAFIRYNSVDESISAYKQAHDLMWDTRSIIVRFRRQRGNTCLPGESKPNLKRVKDEPGSVVHVKKEQQANCREENKTKPVENAKNHSRLQAETNNAQNNKVPIQIQQQSVSLMPTPQSTSSLPTSIAPAKTAQEQQQQPWTSQLPQIPSASEAPPPPHPAERNTVEETIMLTEIKEEPEDYEEMEMAADVQTDAEVDDDDDEEEEDDTDDDDDDDDNEEEDDDEDDDEEMDENETLVDENKRDISVKENEPTDHLDQMFNDLENMAGDIGL